MALTAGLPPMPPPRSLPSWKREGERGEKDRVHLSQVSDGRSRAQLTALPYRTDRNAMMGKHREQRGFFLLLREQSNSENYPTHLLQTRSVLQVNKNKSSCPLAPVICTTNSAQFFTFHASALAFQPTALAADSPEQLHKTQWGNCEME